MVFLLVPHGLEQCFLNTLGSVLPLETFCIAKKAILSLEHLLLLIFSFVACTFMVTSKTSAQDRATLVSSNCFIVQACYLYL